MSDVNMCVWECERGLEGSPKHYENTTRHIPIQIGCEIPSYNKN